MPWQWPHRGVRIGEAQTPGPPRRISGNLRVSSRSDLQLTSMSSSSDLITQSLHTPVTEPIPTDTSQSLPMDADFQQGSNDDQGREQPPLQLDIAIQHEPRPCQLEANQAPVTPPRPAQGQEMSPGHPSTPGTGHDQAPPIKLKLLSGEEITVVCRWVRGCRSWRWQGGARSRKMTKDSRQGPRHALQQWIQQYAPQLNDESIIEAQQALALLPSDTDITPPTASTPRRQRQSQQEEAAPLSETQHSSMTSIQLPSLDIAELIASATTQELLSNHINAQRTLPSSVKTPVMHAMLELWRIGEDLAIDVNVRRAARVMWATAPRWAWPEPQRVNGQRLAPHARPKLIKHQLSLLTQGKWDMCLREFWPPTSADDVEVPLEAGLDRPGLLSEHKLQRLAILARQRRVGKGWKQLWTWGVPPKSRQLNESLCQLISPDDAPIGQAREFPAVPDGDVLQAFWRRWMATCDCHISHRSSTRCMRMVSRGVPLVPTTRTSLEGHSADNPGITYNEMGGNILGPLVHGPCHWHLQKFQG